MSETFPHDISAARDAFLKLKRRGAKRKADRERRTLKRPAQPRQSAPLVRPAKSWTDAEKSHWINALCESLTDGGSMSQFCRDYPQGPERSTWFDWLQADAIFADRYSRARENGADTLADDCIAIADEVKDAGQMDSARVNAARLRVDARKWVASKLKPKTYADRLETVTSGSLTVTHTVTDEDRARVLQSLLARETVRGAGNLIEAQRLIEGKAKDVTPAKTKTADE